MPIGTSAVLPNNLLYYHIKKVDVGIPEDLLSLKKNREDIVCDNLTDLKKGHYIRFQFDNNGLIDKVTYLVIISPLYEKFYSFREMMKLMCNHLYLLLDSQRLI